jgi:predicted aconitase
MRAVLTLDDRDRSMLEGESGAAAALAMRLIVAVGEAVGAERLMDIEGAHIDGCLYHGPVGLAFAERLLEGEGRVRVPTTLNVSALDLLHPALVHLEEPTRAAARRLMAAYEALGCRPTWTCAPYQLPERPAFGQQIAWGESSAIVFANSVLGARTERYGDFTDIAAAITGRVPEAGLHTDRGRRAGIAFQLSGFRASALREDVLYPLLGHVVGRVADAPVVAIEGLPPDASEDQLKALGAAAASSGAVALCHVVGVTPEAPTLGAATGGALEREVPITPGHLRAAAAELSTLATGERIDAVSLGTPHLSLAGFERLTPLLAATRPAPGVTISISTGRDVLREVEGRGWLAAYERPGIQLVVDTCTYITPILAPGAAVVTDSAKWAWYAPANVGARVAFASLEDCLRSAEAGRVVRDRSWLDG